MKCHPFHHHARRLLALACVLGLRAATALALAPTPILIDLNTGNGPIVGSGPARIVRLSATQTVFTAYDPVHGRELWITDGTPANTHLLFDFCPGACSSDPVPLNGKNAAALGVLYVSADDGAHGRELWKITSAGAVSFTKDVNPGALGSSPSPMGFTGAAPSTGLFSATSAASGSELWETDGSVGGTILLKDISPGPASSFPTLSGDTGLNKAYFSASTPDLGSELYMTDGTPAGTVLRADIVPGPDGSGPQAFAQFLNDTMLFTANEGINGRELWMTTPSSTTLLKDIVPGSDGSFPSGLVGFSGRIFFGAYGGPSFSNNELWASDATAIGTVLFKDLCSGSCSSRPGNFVVLNTPAGARLLFTAYASSGAAGPSIFVSDGTSAGTTVLLNLGTTNLSPFTVSGSLAYLIDRDARKLYRTDGTAGGTIEIRDFGSDGFAALGSMGPVGTNKVVLGADDGFVGMEPYLAGPNAFNTQLLENIAPDLGYSDPQELTDVGGTLFFSAFSETTGRELWKVGDPNNGAQLVADIMPGAADSNPLQLHAFNGKLIFAGRDTPTGLGQLYVSDGTPEGTHPLKNLGPGLELRYLNCLTIVGNRLYFNADGSDGNGLGAWVSDGTDAGTIDIHPAAVEEGFCSSGEPGFAAAGSKVLFQAYDSTHGYELFRTDGTLAGTALVRDIVPGGGTSNSSAPGNFVSIGAVACFNVGQGGYFYDQEPWCSDGTAQGTVPLGDLNPGSEDSLPMGFTQVGGNIVFSAFSPTLGRRVWRSDGTAANTIAFGPGGVDNRVRDYQTENATGGTPGAPPFEHDGTTLYFPCTFASTGPGLCLQDTRAGLESNSRFILFIAAVDALRVFPGGDALMACTSANGREPCRFRSGPGDAQAALLDVAPGAASSSPDQFTASGGYVYFTADDGTHGRELYAVALREMLDRIFHDGFE